MIQTFVRKVFLPSKDNSNIENALWVTWITSIIILVIAFFVILLSMRTDMTLSIPSFIIQNAEYFIMAPILLTVAAVVQAILRNSFWSVLLLASGVFIVVNLMSGHVPAMVSSLAIWAIYLFRN